MIMASSKDSDLAVKRRQTKVNSISSTDPKREIHPIPEKHEVDKSQVLNMDEASTSENIQPQTTINANNLIININNGNTK
jgi:hypothetical protein